jgi:signal transduction histidine kinase
MIVASEPLDEKEAKKAIRMAVPNFDSYLKRGQVEIVPYKEWYLQDGTFNGQRALNGWIYKLDQALARGYDGLRAMGNTAWLEKKDWKNFTEYEEKANNIISQYRIVAICAYSLDKCGASELVDIVSNHQLALIRRKGKWKPIENSERKNMEERLRQKEAFNFALFQHNPVETIAVDRKGKVVKTNLARKKARERLPQIGDVMYKDYAAKHELNMHAELMECIRSGKKKRYPQLKYGDRFLDITIASFSDGAIIACQDITESRRAEEQIKNSQSQLRNLVARLQSIKEEERAYIAREMHDELGQALTAMKMDLSWLDKRLTKDQVLQRKKIKSMSKLVDTTLQTIKKISTELRPELLDDLGLSAAIEWQAEEFQTHTGIRCKITVDPEDIILDKDHSTAIFRIFQETLTNIARHAKATKVKVSLKEKAGRLELRVKDNGRGITEEQASDPKSFGLIGIRERAYSFGGKVAIKGLEDKGTTVTVRIPLLKKEKTG